MACQCQAAISSPASGREFAMAMAMAMSLPSTSAAPLPPTSSSTCSGLPAVRSAHQFGRIGVSLSSTFSPRNFSGVHASVICSSLILDIQTGGFRMGTSADIQTGGVSVGTYADGLSRVWKKAPRPLREFPWKRAIERLVERLSDVAWSAAKWLLLPVILLSSLSEISYSLVQNKELLIPIGMLAGSLIAGVLKDTALELSEDLQKEEVPWHLIAIGFLFALVKFPGPSYPYWGRVLLPHFATGGLLRTFFFARSWQNSMEDKYHQK